jgi:hypothetical protein
MKSRWNSLVVGGCNAFGLALLALSVTSGGSAVRAAGDSVSLESLALEPIAKVVSGIEQRVAVLETSIAAFAQSFTAKRIAAQELCVADDSGAQTCITKGQLDALLKGAMRTAQAPATEPAAAAETTAQAASTIEHEHAPAAASCTEKCVAPAAAMAASPSETPAAAEASAALVKETVPAAEQPAAAVKESAPAEGRIAAPPAEQPQATTDTIGVVSAAAEAAIPTPRSKPTESMSAETVIATAATPETLIPAETSAKVEEPAAKAEEPAQASTTGAALAEPKPTPAAAELAAEHKE